MFDFNTIISSAVLTYPEYKTENGATYKLDSFQQTENGFVPHYIETDEISQEEALNIILGGAE